MIFSRHLARSPWIRASALHSNAHTYRLLVFKDHRSALPTAPTFAGLQFCNCQRTDLRSAKKRNYEAVFLTCQISRIHSSDTHLPNCPDRFFPLSFPAFSYPPHRPRLQPCSATYVFGREPKIMKEISVGRKSRELIQYKTSNDGGTQAFASREKIGRAHV